MAETLATRYAKAMEEHPYGYALFRPALSKSLKPGCCGYVDKEGRWTPILTDIQHPSREGFSASASLDPIEPRVLTWGPKTSTDMAHRSVAFEAGADALAAGFPVEVKLAMNFSTTKDFGAILHCSDDVHEQGFYHRTPFLSWAKANAQAILKACPDAKDHGVWVVASTFETQKVDINAWMGAEKTVSMGFTVAVPAAGELGPSGEFVRSRSASGWNHDAVEDGQGRLVPFFTGVFLRYKYLPFGLKGLRVIRGGEEFRADEEIIKDGENDVAVKDPQGEDVFYKVVLETVGSQIQS